MTQFLLTDSGLVAQIPALRFTELHTDIINNMIDEHIAFSIDTALTDDTYELYDKYMDLLEIEGLRDVNSCYKFLKSIQSDYFDTYIAIIAVCEYLQISHFTNGYILDILGKDFFMKELTDLHESSVFTEKGEYLGEVTD